MQAVNPRYREAANTRKRFRVIFGGAGSGKSVFVMQDVLERAAVHGLRIIILRKTHRSHRNSTFQLALDIIFGMNWGGYCSVDKTAMRIDFPYSRGSVVCLGLDDREKLKSLAGVDHVWIEEASEISLLDFLEVNRRLRGVGKFPKQITLTLNPVHPQLWVRLLLVDRVGVPEMESPSADQVFVIKTTWRDNWFNLDKEYIRQLKSYRGAAGAIYERGEWAADTELLIYPEWQWTDTFPDDDYSVYGMDYGFSQPASLVEISGAKDDRFVVDEKFYRGGLTHVAIVAECDRLGIDKDKPMYVDSAEPELIELLYSRGYNALPAQKSVEAGIMAVKSRNLYLVEGSSNLAKELYAYSWAVDREGNRLDKVVKKFDHACDGTRYGIFSHFGPGSESWLIN